MKPLSLLLFVCMVLTATEAAAQTSMISSGYDMMIFLNSDLDYLKNQAEKYATIEGSAYLDEVFREGSISFNQKKYVGLRLRYNSYEGTFEFETEQGVKFFDPKITPVDTVWMEGATYVYVLYQSGKARKRIYMELMSNRATKVLQYHRVILTQPEPAKGYAEAKAARFDHLPETIYIQREGQPAREFKGKKSLKDLFPGHHSQLSAYAKSSKLKLKKAEEIIALCSYFDTLQQAD